jgi:hypothetical protein
MRKLLVVVIALGISWMLAEHLGPRPVDLPPRAADAPSDDARAAAALDAHRSGEQMEGRGTVTRVLADDNDGDRHQRFILRLDSGQTLLIAHNIDLAPRVAGLKEGDIVEFRGEYEWNDKGGVIHWTHKDPRGQHEAGWLKRQGRTYQ